MTTKTSFIIRLLDKPFIIEVFFSNYEFSVHFEDKGLVGDGFFRYSKNNPLCFFPRTEVSLFSDLLENKILRAMKTEKEAWKAMMEYQKNKK